MHFPGFFSRLLQFIEKLYHTYSSKHLLLLFSWRNFFGKMQHGDELFRLENV